MLGALICFSLSAGQVLCVGGITFEGPFRLNDVPPPPVTVHTGDFNNDGKVDLACSNGTGIVTVLFQDRQDRETWTVAPVRVGSSCYLARGGDFDGDGYDDLMVADGASSAYYVRSKGAETFDTPIGIPQARGPRRVAEGDWNKDGRLDFATSNLNTSTLTTFLNEVSPEGALKFRRSQDLVSGRDHSLEALDFDGDGLQDLVLGMGSALL